MRTQRYWFFTYLLAIVLNVSLITAVRADTTEAINYLTAQQAIDGSYNTSITFPSRATSETLRAFRSADLNNQSGIAQAQVFLNSVEQSNTEHIARLLVANAQAGKNVQTLVDTLLFRQNSDGGFGNLVGYNSDVLDTAIVLEALIASRQVFTNATVSNTTAALSAANFLKNKQNVNGSWSLRNNDASVFMSALAMRALWHYERVFPDIESNLRKAQSYLLAQRNVNNGLWSKTYESALALIAIIPNVNEFAQVESIVNNLKRAQLADGSWDNDTYTTALVIRALNSQPTPVAPIVGLGAISGNIVNAQTRQAVKNAIITIENIPLSTSSSDKGAFNLLNIDPAADYSVSISIDGYKTVRFDGVTVNADQDTHLGLIELYPLAGTGVVQGVIADSVTGQVLEGVSISLSDNSISSVSTSDTGNYSIAGIGLGSLLVTYSKDGYQPTVIDVSVIDGKTLVLNPALTPIAIKHETLSSLINEGWLEGATTDAVTGLPLGDVSIRVSGSGNERYLQSSRFGVFQFRALNPGKVDIILSKQGYQTTTVSTTIFAGNKIQLNSSLVPVNETELGSNIITVELLPVALFPELIETGSIRGAITDIETGQPISGASILVSGSSTVAVFTGNDGGFNISGLTAGNVIVRASHDNYIDMVVKGEVVANNSLVIDLALSKNTFTNTQQGSVIGQVVEAQFGSSLNQVQVEIIKNGETISTTVLTDAYGFYEFKDLLPGNYAISFKKDGYLDKAYDVVVIGGGKVNLQKTELLLALKNVTLFGQIRDIVTDEAIKNVFVSIADTALEDQTDNQGRYRISDISTGAQTLLINATGYEKQSISFNYSVGGQYELDRELIVANNPGLDINSISTDQVNYKAYTPIKIESRVFNNATLQYAGVEFSLYNGQEQKVAEATGVRLGSQDSLIAFPSGQATSITGEINTTNLQPGTYRLIGRILDDVSIAQTPKIIDEYVVSIVIQPEAHISDLTTELLPITSAVGVTETLNVVAKATNLSNIVTTIKLKYRILDSTGANIKNSGINQYDFATIFVTPQSNTVQQLLTSFSHTFTTSGQYTLEVLYEGGSEPDVINTVGMQVVPGLRVDAAKDIAPGTVIPSPNQRIRINVQLDGKEVQ